MQGISNLGSTCAINSLIQILYRNEKIRNAIMKTSTVKRSITNELQEIFEMINNSNNTNNEIQVIHPHKFIKYFYETFEGIFNKYEQIDINELWMFLYEKINEETSIIKELDINPIKNMNDEHDMKINIYNNKKESELLKTVQGSYINIIQCCNCNYKSYSFEPFINLNIDITNTDNKNKTLVELIINHFKVETREDEWTCDNCKNKCKYLKTVQLWKLPEVLFITLNRFKDINKKNNDEIIINHVINFNKGSVMSLNSDRSFILTSMGLHNGSLMGGHYTSLCKFNDDFYLYNDEQINKIKKDDIGIINANSVYMVIYELS